MPVYGLVYPIGLLVIRLVCRSSEEAILIIRVLELIGVDLRLLSATCLRFSVIPKLVSYSPRGTEAQHRVGSGVGVRGNREGGTRTQLPLRKVPRVLDQYLTAS